MQEQFSTLKYNHMICSTIGKTMVNAKKRHADFSSQPCSE